MTWIQKMSYVKTPKEEENIFGFIYSWIRKEEKQFAIWIVQSEWNRKAIDTRSNKNVNCFRMVCSYGFLKFLVEFVMALHFDLMLARLLGQLFTSKNLLDAFKEFFDWNSKQIDKTFFAEKIKQFFHINKKLS